MYTINQTEDFSNWVSNIKDNKAKAAISLRLRRAMLGNLGTVKSLNEGVFEMKIDVGAGYRLYYGQEGKHIYLMFWGGDKSTQEKDIKIARKLWKEIKGA
ncbi:type II toxin-antitoxin system RelE/ParE family toxin [Pelistega suis]|uniref:Type II toxin-antitoxin system RelE/ParE family toxin n=1 Tax=Pelistega suis TaxID=1631957 RepID=A0A849P053_9BURK|nr:type II toxin-antitoxin system RelE/ParE family toxin [Pelistega suis]NOL51139.1 type II toxin-antitoxin system RelE/ParE family toxin [Pelistega suis]